VRGHFAIPDHENNSRSAGVSIPEIACERIAGKLGVSIGAELLTRIGAEELTTLQVEALEGHDWRRAAKRSAVRLGAPAC
jgi:hypothetical protein